jgi:hypothetical protein
LAVFFVLSSKQAVLGMQIEIGQKARGKKILCSVILVPEFWGGWIKD